MFIKGNLIGATVAALALLAPAATMAQAPRPDFPGAKQQDPYSQRLPGDPAFAPRPDFPGAKQPDSGTAKMPQSDLQGSQQGQAPSQK